MENRGPIIIRNGPKHNVTGNELKCSYDTFISGLLLVIVKEQSFSNLCRSSSLNKRNRHRDPVLISDLNSQKFYASISLVSP